MEYLAYLGLVWVIKHGEILNLPRNFISRKIPLMGRLLKCTLCLGFWVGISAGGYSYYAGSSIYDSIVTIFSISAFCWIGDTLMDFFQIWNQKIKMTKKL
jgi:hypothetical protein